MNDLNKKLSYIYKIKFVTSTAIEEDIRLIKKLNVLFNKLEKSRKDIYVQEIINVLKILNNVFHLNQLTIILYENVDVEYHKTLNYILREIAYK